jgi:flagellar motor switch protein FliG
MLDDPMSELPGFPPLPGAVTLTMREKAAIVVRLLLSHGALPALSRLSETKQTELALQIARMTPVDQETVHAVADEFANEIERIALSFPQGLDGAIGLLDGVLSEGATTRLRKLAPSDTRRNPWEEIEKVEVERLLPFFQREAVEVAAVAISKLSTGKAAAILGKLPGDMARRIAYAISKTGNVAPSVVHRIGASLAEELDTRPVTAFPEPPVKRVGAILNYTPASVRDGMLDAFEAEDSVFAAEVRAAIFTFANIPERIAPRDVPRLQRDIAQDDLTLVVAGATAEKDLEAVEFLLGNISKRMAESIRDEAKEKAEVKTEDLEAAMLRIVSTIRDLEARGEIFLVSRDD